MKELDLEKLLEYYDKKEIEFLLSKSKDVEHKYLEQDRLSLTGIHFPTGYLVDKMLTKETYKKYKHWYINLATIIRNFLNSLPGEAEDKIKFLKVETNLYKLVDEILSDIDLMLSYVSDLINVVIYRNTYEKFLRYIGTVKKPEDHKGLTYYILKSIDILIEIILEKISIPVPIYDTNIPAKDKTLLTTHIPLDMLSYTNIPIKAFYESFTAEIKEQDKFYTKFNKLTNKDMSIIPFLDLTYYVYGDKNFKKPANLKLRRFVYDVAMKHAWNYKTQRYKVISDIKKEDPNIGKSFLKIKRLF